MSARLVEEGALRLELAGESLRLFAERALLVERDATLVVADLHWGKSETFRAHGVGLPRGVLDADLARLSRVLRRSGARRLLVLGDLVHAPEGLTPALVERVAAWRRSHPLDALLVRGNHERRIERLPVAWKIEVREAPLVNSPFAFVHDTEADPPTAAGALRVGGHLHPLARLVGGGDALRLPAFVLEAGRMLLPAFSAFTAGVTFGPARGRRVVAVAEDALVDLGGD